MSLFRKEYRDLSTEEKERLDDIKTKAQELYDLFEGFNESHDGRCLALAKTKLEESVMWGVKGITN